MSKEPEPAPALRCPACDSFDVMVLLVVGDRASCVCARCGHRFAAAAPKKPEEKPTGR